MFIKNSMRRHSPQTQFISIPINHINQFIQPFIEYNNDLTIIKHPISVHGVLQCKFNQDSLNYYNYYKPKFIKSSTSSIRIIADNNDPLKLVFSNGLQDYFCYSFIKQTNQSKVINITDNCYVYAEVNDVNDNVITYKTLSTNHRLVYSVDEPLHNNQMDHWFDLRENIMKQYAWNSDLQEFEWKPVYRVFLAACYIDDDLTTINETRFWYPNKHIAELWGQGDSPYQTVIIDPNRLPGPSEDQITYDHDRETGFYGEVPSSEFIDGETLANEIGLTSGSSINSNTEWLKFYYKGKILYTPKLPIRQSVTWNDLYNVGAVYGTYNYGKSNSGINVVQSANVTINGYTYTVRLARGATEDPNEFIYNQVTCDDKPGNNSEWNELMYRIHTEIPSCDDPTIGMSSNSTVHHGGPQFGDNWNAYLNSNLDITNINTLCQERTNTDDMIVTRGTYGLASYSAVNKEFSTSLVGWRPILEIIIFNE